MIDLLPDKLILMILNYVDLSDLLYNCKLVSKKFLSFISEIKFNELIVTKFFLYDNYWYSDLRPINLKNVIQFKRIDFLSYSSFKTNFSKLKYFKFYSYFDDCKPFFNYINDFSTLEHLEFGCGHLSLCEQTNEELFFLNLPNLRILKIRSSLRSNHQLTINANRLEILYCFDLNNIKLINKSSIKCLQIRYSNNLNLAKFKSLEIFKIDNWNNQIPIVLPNSLNQLYIDSSIEDLEMDDDSSDEFIMNSSDDEMDFTNDVYKSSFDIWRTKIDQFLIKKNSKFKFYFLNVLIKPERSFESYKFEQRNKFNFYYENYDCLAERLSYSQIEYNRLMSLFRELPFDFFNKFSNIQKITAKKIKNQQHFMYVLSCCPCLTELSLHCPKLDQKFYDKIPSLNSRLTHFYLVEIIDVKINYEFILKFNALVLFNTSQYITPHLALKAMKKLKFLQDFTFNGNGTIILSKLVDTGKFAIKLITYEFVQNKWKSKTVRDHKNLNYNQLEQICNVKYS